MSTSATPLAFSLSAAIDWLDRLLLGSAGTTIAVLAVAIVGFSTLRGRYPVRRGVSVVLGCFILFGAPLIAAGLLDAVRANAVELVPATPAPPPAYSATIPQAVPYDPYAGASVPTRESQPAIDLSLQ